MEGLSGKSALVTGASRGIGAEAAKALAAAGVGVVLAARSVDKAAAVADEITAAGGRAEAITCDVARYGDVAAAVERAAAAFGGIDILVNNAGLIEPVARIDESDPEAWGYVIDVNLKGVYHGIRAAIPAMRASGDGSGVIINISSGAAVSALEGWSHYCSSKAAVLSLTRCTQKEWGERGIRTVGLSPGTVATEMQRQIKASGVNPVSQLAWESHIPPEWVGRAIVWLCSEDAADFAGDDVRLRDEDIRKRIGLI
ncbi:MAG: SDR family NAD(P)-dependent oxidoreductase [Pikeienuella sp.]